MYSVSPGGLLRWQRVLVFPVWDLDIQVLCVGLQIPDLEVQISELDDHILMWMSMFWIWKSIARDLDIQIQDVDALHLGVQMRDLEVTSGFGCPNPRCIRRHPGFRNPNTQFQRTYVSGRPNTRKHSENPNLWET